MTALIRPFLVLLLTAFMAACSGSYTASGNLDPNVAMHENSHTTVLVYSQVSKDGSSRVFFRDPQQHRAGRYTATEWHPMQSNDLNQGEFKGSLKVLALRGDALEFYRWQWQNATGVLDRFGWNARVKLEPRQVIYLGRLMIDEQEGQTQLKVVDASEEDLGRFRSRYTNLANVPIQTRLLKEPQQESAEAEDTLYLP